MANHHLPILLFPMSLVMVSCTYTSTTAFRMDRDPHTVANVAKNVAEKLQMTTTPTRDSVTTYLRRKDEMEMYSFKPVVQLDKEGSSQVSLVTYSDYQSRSDNLGIAIRSFMEQTADSSLVLKHPEQFFVLPPKSADEMYKKNWISPALGIHYTGKDNPFADKADYTLGTAFFAFWDILHAVAIVGGPFFGKSTGDRIGIPIVGILSAVGWRLLVPGMQSRRDLEEYNNITQSGYQLPSDLKGK